MRQETTIIEYNPAVVAFKIQELVLQGWRIMEDRPFTQMGVMWEVGMERDPTQIQLDAEAAAAAKLTRPEILAKARAAKAEKNKAENENKEKSTNE